MFLTIAQSVGRKTSGVQAAIHAPCIAEHPTRAAGTPTPSVNVPGSRQYHQSLPHVRSRAQTRDTESRLERRTGDTASRYATRRVPDVTSSLTDCHSTRSGDDDRKADEGRKRESEEIGLHSGDLVGLMILDSGGGRGCGAICKDELKWKLGFRMIGDGRRLATMRIRK